MLFNNYFLPTITSKTIMRVWGSSWHSISSLSLKARTALNCSEAPSRLSPPCSYWETVFPKPTLPSDNTFNSKYKLWWLRIICFANFWFLNNPDNMTTFLPGGRVFWLATYGAKQKQDQKATVQYQYVPYLYKHQASSKVLNGTGMHYLVCWLSQASETWYR